MEKTIQRIPFLRLSAALATGILSGPVLKIDPLILIISSLLFLFGLYWINRKFKFHLDVIFGIGVHILFVLIGILAFTHYNEKPVFFIKGKFCATVCEILQEKPNSYETVLNINALLRNDTVYNCDEKIRVWFAKSAEAGKLNPGDVIFFNRSPEKIKNDNNPYAFDYKTYLARKKIYRQLYLSAENWTNSNISARFSLPVYAEKIRLRMLTIYGRQIDGNSALNILSALTLGYKRGLGEDTRQTFASTGAMHVLAVSGLHTGIIFYVISLLFGFLKKREAGRIIFVFIVLVVLWSFAFVTGLSPSVKRAATMFSFVVAGQGIKRRSSIYNTLTASAFFLLILNPNNLFDAGFQLSYAAVFGIVFLQQDIDKFVHYKNKILRYGLGLITVSASAQVATFPLSVYYFNQFPVYGLLSNLLVIPAVTLLIPLGMGLLLFHWIPVAAKVLSVATRMILDLMVCFLEKVEKLPFSTVEFTFSEPEMIFICSMLVSVFIFIKTKKTKYFKFALFSFLFLITTSLVIKTYNLFRKEIIVYNFPGQVLVHLVSGRTNYVVSEQSISENGIALNMIKQTVQALKLKNPVFLTAGQFYRDSGIWLKSGVVYFEGKIIALDEVPGAESFFIHFLIGPYSVMQAESIHYQGKKIISTLRYAGEYPARCAPVFFLGQEGAFREKW